jgi:hypothetical protein
MIEAWIRQSPNEAMGLFVSFIFAIDASVLALFHSGATSGRKRKWYRMWSRRLASLNGIFVRIVLVLWIVLHVWWMPGR